jgi:hypothetical protein
MGVREPKIKIEVRWMNTIFKSGTATVAVTLKYFFLIRIGGGGVQTGSTRHVSHFWPVVPAPGDCDDGEFGGMKIGRGNRSTRRKFAPAPLCPQQIPLVQIRTRTRAAEVGSQRLTA